MAKLTGKAGVVKLNGTALKVTSWSAEIPNDNVDMTDTGDFNETLQQTWKSRVKNVRDLTFTAEGNVYTENIATLVALATADAEVTVDLLFRADVPFGYFNALVSISAESPVDDKASFTMEGEISGAFNAGARP